jgi:rhodanese-related sulfurtransferase
MKVRRLVPFRLGGDDWLIDGLRDPDHVGRMRHVWDWRLLDHRSDLVQHGCRAHALAQHSRNGAEGLRVKNIDVREAYKKQSEGYTYVDVRSVPEFEAGHPSGAVNVPLLHRDARTGQMMPNHEFLAVMRANFPADARLLVGCQMGGRSAQAAQVLSASGYRDVSNVTGGYGGNRNTGAEGWALSGLPVETAAEGRTYDALRARASGSR